MLVAAFVFYRFGRRGVARALGAAALGWLLLISTPWLPEALLVRLENRYVPVKFAGGSDRPVHLLVLGSGYTADARLPYTAKLHQNGVTRLAEAIRLHRMMPGSRLVFSGYGGREPLPQAMIYLQAAAELGIDSSLCATLPTPWNTRAEALAYKERFGTKHKLYLITDAAHMPRAMLHFRKAGLQPIPAPAAYMIKNSRVPKELSAYRPASVNIRNMEIVFHEYMGIYWAKLGGK